MVLLLLLLLSFANALILRVDHGVKFIPLIVIRQRRTDFVDRLLPQTMYLLQLGFVRQGCVIHYANRLLVLVFQNRLDLTLLIAVEVQHLRQRTHLSVSVRTAGTHGRSLRRRTLRSLRLRSCSSRSLGLCVRWRRSRLLRLRILRLRRLRG